MWPYLSPLVKKDNAAKTHCKYLSDIYLACKQKEGGFNSIFHSIDTLIGHEQETILQTNRGKCKGKRLRYSGRDSHEQVAVNWKMRSIMTSYLQVVTGCSDAVYASHKARGRNHVSSRCQRISTATSSSGCWRDASCCVQHVADGQCRHLLSPGEISAVRRSWTVHVWGLPHR